MRVGTLFQHGAISLLALFATPAIAAPCHPPQGLAAIAAAHERYVIFGEVHGTDQSPALVGEVACALVQRKQHLLVALELRASVDAVLQVAWAGPPATFRSTLLDTMPDWRERRDGVVSQAMLTLLDRLHTLKSAGGRIDVVAFTGARDEAQRARLNNLPAQGPNEAAQAENIRAAAGRARYDRVLVLVGNLHARKQPVTFGSITYEPMAMRLAPVDDILSLNMADAGGTAWNCVLKGPPAPGPVTSDRIDCASHPQSAVMPLSGASRLGRWAAFPTMPAQSGYDGLFFVGAITASLPAGTTPNNGTSR